VPTLVQLMLWYFGISSLMPEAVQGWLGEHNGEAVFAVIGLGLC
jgi:polar amino acid transport system permease protein